MKTTVLSMHLLSHVVLLFLLNASCLEAHEGGHGDSESSSVVGRRFLRGGLFGQDEFGCGTRDSSILDVILRRRRVRAYENKVQQGELRADETYTIPVCFFILMDDEGNYNRTNEQIQGQLEHMNHAFSGDSCCDTELDWCEPGSCSVDTGIRFAWQELDDNEEVIKGSTVSNMTDEGACVFRLQDKHWRRLSNVKAEKAKKRLHKGGKDVLNVFWGRLLSGLNGYANRPPTSNHQHAIQKDGVVVVYDRIFGGEDKNDSEGDLLVHETGHWLDLGHTFEGGCLFGDGIQDTAPQHTPFRGCSNPLEQDTCRHDDKMDPVFNFMDYGDDRCSYRFTPGQTLVMRAAYSITRLGNEVEREVISLTSGVPSPPLNLVEGQVQTYAMNATSAVECTTEAEVYHGLYLKWDREPRRRRFLDDCVSKKWFRRNEKCSVRYRSGRQTLYASIQSSHSTIQNLTITCTEQG